ncbi:retrovirus-related pol polyprotein from transposon TNT 1-94 [Tanacetum coccineum]
MPVNISISTDAKNRHISRAEESDKHTALDFLHESWTHTSLSEIFRSASLWKKLFAYLWGYYEYDQMDNINLDGIVHQKFYVANVRNAHVESDSDDNEDDTGLNRDKYLSCDDPMDRALALQEDLSSLNDLFMEKDNSFSWSFARPTTKCQTVGTHDDEAGSSRPKRTRVTETVKEAMLGRVHHNFLLWGTCNRAAKAKYNTNLARLLPKQIYAPCIIDWNVLNTLGCAEAIKEMLKIKIVEMGGQEEIFTSKAWRNAFDIKEHIYTELCHKFYSTYEFDEVVTNEELITKKLIKFKLGGRGPSLTLLQFARRLGLYHSAQICEEGFEVYFQGGLRSDEHFNAREYWLSISSEDKLNLSRSATQTIRSPVLRVLQNMITYGLRQRTIGTIAKWLKRKGVGSQGESMIYCGQFMTRSLDATTIRELIGSNRRLIVEDPTPGVPRVAMPRPSRPTMQDLYEWIGLGHNLFSVGKFCDCDLEVAFRSKTCYVRNLEGDDLLTGDRESNLYTISIPDMADSSPICLMSKASSTKSWLWHHRLSHLNFGTINDLTKHDLVDGLPKFKYGKDHLCSACERGKSKKASHPPKLVPSSHSKLELLHMDLCGSMRVASINGKKYILVIVDDYSRFTWVYFLHSKDETPETIKKFIAQVQLNYDAKIHKIQTDNGTEFKNATLKAHYES